MDNFTYQYISGTVLSSQKHSQSHVYSEGGGRITTGRNIVGDPVLRGKIEAPNIKSYNTTNHEIFLQLEDGQEISVSFPFDDIALREGHFITFLIIFRVGVTDGYYTRLFNHNTRSNNNLLSNMQWRELTNPYLQNLSSTKELPREAKSTSKSSLFNRLVASYRRFKDELNKGWEGASPDAIAAYKNKNTDAPITQHEINQPLALEFAQVINEAMLRL
jgi:hypothetical protein